MGRNARFSRWLERKRIRMAMIMDRFSPFLLVLLCPNRITIILNTQGLTLNQACNFDTLSIMQTINQTIDQRLAKLGIQIPEILLPAPQVDLGKWAVIACDQFTSDKTYWEKVQQLAGHAPSTLNLIIPECYLEEAHPEFRINNLWSSMNSYLAQGILASQGRGMIATRRKFKNGQSRLGLVLSLDLEMYDFHKDSQSPIRATERTIEERLPPRIKVREKAPIELPHILVLLDDKPRKVIESLFADRQGLKKLYDFELMLDGGRIEGYFIDSSYSETLLQFTENMESLDQQTKRSAGSDSFLYAMGDGNHSFATAKAVWERIKRENPASPALAGHPARYALVELLNIYDPGLNVEPIHRILFNVDINRTLAHMEASGIFRIIARSAHKNFGSELSAHKPYLAFTSQASHGLIEVIKPTSSLVAGSLQEYLMSSGALKQFPGRQIDYIHDSTDLKKLAAKTNALGLILPPINRDVVFQTVRQDGLMPLKTFSLGHAREKRYYLEARRIWPGIPG